MTQTRSGGLPQVGQNDSRELVRIRFRGYLDVLKPDVNIVVDDLQVGAVAPYVGDMEITEVEAEDR